MKRALFFVYIDSHFVELSRIAALLRDRGGYAPVFMFAYRYPTLERDLAHCRAEAFDCIDADGRPMEAGGDAGQPAADSAAVAQTPRRPDWRERIWNAVPERMKRLLRALSTAGLPGGLGLALGFPYFGSYVNYYRAQARSAHATMAKVAPALLVLPEDNIELNTGLLVRAAHARRIPAVIVPFTIVNAEEIAEAYWHNPDFWVQGWRRRLVAALFPRWARVHRGRRLFPLLADRILALEFLGLAPPLPWIVNSGDADAIAVEGPFMRRYYEAAGLPPAKLRVTGALYDDVIARELRAAAASPSTLRDELGIARDKPLLLCALPPDQYRSKRPGAEFPTYEAMVRAWARSLTAAGRFSVLVRLHPRMLREELAYLESDYGLRIVERDTATLIPHCDVYVASVSATIRLAIAAGKPVVNYDCYRFRYGDFGEVPGVITVENEADFSRALHALEDRTHREAVADEQRRFAARANLIDGRAHERLMALFESLVNRS